MRAKDVSFVSGVVVCNRCHRESRPQERGGIAQAWATWPEGASAQLGTMMYRGHGVPEKVSPAMRTTAVWSVFQTCKYAMYSLEMLSGMANDSDMLKIFITLCQAQKVGDTEPHKNFNFLCNSSVTRAFYKFSRNSASF